MNVNLHVALLAGGESTRFWPLSSKNEMVFLGKPLLLWHFEQLQRLGFSDVTVVVNEENEESIKRIVPPKDLRVTYVIQKGRGQGEAVKALALEVGSSPVFILNASDYYADSFLLSYKKHIQNSNGVAILGAVHTDAYFPGGYLAVNESGSVTKIIEKPTPGTEPSTIVRINADYFPNCSTITNAVEKISADPKNAYEEAMNELIKNNMVFQVEITPMNSWHPLKYPWDTLSMMDVFLSTLTKKSIHKSVVIKDHVIIEGPVVIEEGVKIFEGSKIVGPVYIGKNTIIGNNNIIRSSMLGNDCVTGFNSDITRSYIGNNCWFHRNYVGDSILGDDISLGSGAVLANLRLDDGEISSIVKKEKIATGKNKLGAMIGSHVRIGVNASVMPGIKIGRGSFIGSGVILDKDVEDKQFCVGTSSAYTVKANTAVPASSREAFRKGL